jgi:DNA ligase (NAD+)
MTAKHDYKQHPSTDFPPVDQLSKEEARQQIAALREGIEYHDHRYYVKNEPEISDARYDQLFQRLQELEQAFPEFQSETSPTRRVGAEPVDKLNRVEHTAPMLSLKAALQEDEVAEFCGFVSQRAGQEEVPYVAEPKFDGVSVELVYQDGRFVRAATRGDGQTGEDVSENVKTIGAVPMRLRNPESARGLLAVRGEVYISKDAFQEMNRHRVQQNEDPYANPRNAAAGILRRLESRQVARWPLDLICYDVMQSDQTQSRTHSDELGRLEKWGFRTTYHVRRASSLQQLRKFHQQLEKGRDDLPFEIDGIVIKVDNRHLQNRLGTRDRNPRWALAWKFSPRKEITRLEDIVIQVGMTGMLTPVALLQPVDVGGVTVSRATLHNERQVQEKDLRVGDRVRIERAGDVIPEVVQRIKTPGRKRSEPFAMPRRCPACDSELVHEQVYWFCPAGLACPPQLIGRLVHYASREALDIQNLGDRTVRALVDREMVGDLADLYQLQADDLLQLENFAEKSARQLHEAIQQARSPRLDRFLFGLGIRHVGRKTARLLAAEFTSLDKLRKADEQRLAELPDIGPTVAHAVRQFFDDPSNQRVLDRLKQAGVEVQEMPRDGRALPLRDKVFVFTGKLEHYTREQAKEEVETRGGTATSSVSSNTDCVVVGEDPGSKLDAAREQEIPVIDEKEFEQLLSR